MSSPAASWAPTWWARTVRQQRWSLVLADDAIVVGGGAGTTTLPLDQLEELTIRRGAVHIAVGAYRAALPGISRTAGRELRSAVARRLIDGWWHSTNAALREARETRRWFTEERIAAHEAEHARAIRHVDPWVHRLLSQALPPEVWSAANSPSAVRDWAAAHNDWLVAAELHDQRDFFSTVEKTPLTREQATAVICFDNRVQLIASAGSGKTSTIVAKAIWAMRKQIAQPDEILLLAFNKRAADEISARMRSRLAALGMQPDGVRATTFHAFGLHVIGEATGRKPRVFAGLENDNGIERMGSIVASLRAADPEFRTKWWLLQNAFGPLADNENDDEPDADAYDRDSKRSGFRARDGRVYASAGERAIANWLLSAGVRYEYERPYEVDVADATHSQYRPDFYYPDARVYHEHWAFVPGEQVPESFDGYLESAEWKRATHAANGTALIQTAASGLTDGTLFSSLEQQLRAHGLDPGFDPEREIAGAPMVADADLLRLCRVFLTHAKSNRLTDAELRARVPLTRRGRPRWRDTVFLDVFAKLRVEWDRQLRGDDEVDFEDMLNLATDLIENGSWSSPYRVVLVDEFQDASHARARLVKSLVAAPGRHLFAVGDDWQSIYRFAGADLSAMTRFTETFGPGHVLRLERTFRNSQQLSTVAGDFVSQNPTQLRKTVRSDIHVVDPVTLALVDDADGAARAIHRRISAIAAGLGPRDAAVVKVLGRYQADASLVPRGSWPGVRVEFQTVHSSKGLEADHVIIPGMDRGAFPSTRLDDPLLRLAMPAGDSFRFAEERRLFYVALTRARKTVHLIAQRGRESDFVVELISAGAFEDVPASLELPRVCHVCGRGTMVTRRGPYSTFLACSRFPACTAREKPAAPPSGRSRGEPDRPKRQG